MKNFNLLLKLIFLLIMLSTGFLWAAKEQNIAQQLKSLPIFSQKTIDHQNCLKLSTDLYINLMEKGLDTTRARLVFILVNPYKRNVSKLTPNRQYLCYSSKTHWDWHSFLFFDGKAYDPFCSEFGIELNRYYEIFWKKQKFTKKPPGLFCQNERFLSDCRVNKVRKKSKNFRICTNYVPGLY